jgi:hypothetical protein
MYRASQLKRNDVFICNGIKYRVLRRESGKAYCYEYQYHNTLFPGIGNNIQVLLIRNIQNSSWGIIGRYRSIWKRLLTWDFRSHI